MQKTFSLSVVSELTKPGWPPLNGLRCKVCTLPDEFERTKRKPKFFEKRGAMYLRIEPPGSSAMTLGCRAMCQSGLPDPRGWVQGTRPVEYFFTEYGWGKKGPSA